GEGRVTVAVDRSAASALLSASVRRLVVRSRGTRREFELLSLLRRAGRRFRRLTVRADGALAGRTLADAAVRAEYDVAVLAVRAEGRWTVGPDGDRVVNAGDEVVVVGAGAALDRFASEAA
ncbi:TrkA C-terminal domain-containing protein, partial [Candidatus Halobonum tyrrellensis]